MSQPKLIKSANINSESSYANSILQGFLHLECVKIWINYLKEGDINNSFYNKALTKDLYLLFCNLTSGSNLDSSQLIKDFEINIQNIFHKNINKDPYHFLYYFLEILHYENNFPIESNINSANYKKELMKNISNDINVFNIFNDYFKKTQNSFISQNFFNIQKNMMTCPVCKSLYNYRYTKIIKFNLDELVFIRNQINPQKANNNISLNDCFRYNNKMRPINCFQGCKKSAYQFQSVYNASNVLIIFFKRHNRQNNFKNDVKFYDKFDISQFIINKNVQNTNYILKAIISSYTNGKYCSYVLINKNFYQFMDCPGMNEVKLIKDTNELMIYEPHILIYELDYQNNSYKETIINPIIETKMVLKANFMNNLEQTVKKNYNLFNSTPKGTINCNFKSINSDELNSNFSNFSLKFLLIPSNWNGSEQNAYPINVQVNENLTVEETITNFFKVFSKPKVTIINFIFNNIKIDVKSKQTLKEMNINQNSVIYALKVS